MLNILEKIMCFLSFIAILIVDGAVGMLIYYCIEGGDYTKEQIAFMIALAICLLYISYNSLMDLIALAL